MDRNSRRLLILLLIAAAGVIAWQQLGLRRANERRRTAELDAGRRAAAVLTATLGRQASLRVATLTGKVVAQGSCTSARLFTNGQQTVVPYSVAYSVDLARVDRAAYRWDGRDRVMFVRLPGVLVEAPALDVARARSTQTGVFISRACGLAMQQQVAGRLATAAADKAMSPAYLVEARESARRAIEALTRAPLAAAGVGGVTVRVRFATDPEPQDDRRWDVSRSLEDVLGNAT